MNKMDNSQSKYEKALEYEIFVKKEYGFFVEKIRSAECIFDVWWHIWLFTKWCRNYNSDAEIHYFEPITDFYKRALEVFDDDKRVVLNNFWIGSYTGAWVMLYNNEKTMQSSKYSSFLNPRWIEVDVNFITLKEYLVINNILKIDVLKMDIEWMEFEVLTSFSDFEWWKIENLVVEVHILDDEKKALRNKILFDIKNRFNAIKIFNSWYRDEVFLLYASKLGR